VTVVIRLGVAIFAAIELVLGFWTTFFPESFYNDVPTVDLTPPFSEHLMRDFGSATLGLAVVLGAAAIWPTTRLVVVALLAYLTFSVPHFVFHANHLEGATPIEAGVLMTTLVASVVVPAGLVVAAVAVGAAQRMTPVAHSAE
jgi:hypothetical protein